jgi:succinoglycan biosynthesis protein ExoM
MTKNKINVCVVVYAEDDFVEEGLLSVIKQPANELFDFTLTIFDMTDGVRVNNFYEKLKNNSSVAVKYRPIHVRIISVAKNIALRDGNFTFTVFLGQGLVVSDNWLSVLYERAEGQNADIVYGPVGLSDNLGDYEYVSLFPEGFPDCLDNYLVRNCSVEAIAVRFEIESDPLVHNTVILFNKMRESGMTVVGAAAAAAEEKCFHFFYFRWIRKRWYSQGNCAAAFLLSERKSNSIFLCAQWACLVLFLILFFLPVLPCFFVKKKIFFRYIRAMYYALGKLGGYFGLWEMAGHVEAQNVSQKYCRTVCAVPLRVQNWLKAQEQHLGHVCVCIPTYKRAELLKKLLCGLARQSTAGLFTYSVVIVDNDEALTAKPVVDSFSAAVQFDVRYYSEPVKNISIARNNCVKHAQGDYLAFIDDDEYPASDWLLNMYCAITATEVDAVGGVVFPVIKPEFPGWLISLCMVNYRLYYNFTYNGTIFSLSTNNLLCRMNLIKKYSSPFDPRFGVTGGEDTIFFKKIRDDKAQFFWFRGGRVYEYILPYRQRLQWFMCRFYRYGVTYSEVLVDGQSFLYRLRVACRYVLRFLFFLLVLPWKCIAFLWSPVRIYEYFFLIFIFLGYFSGVLGLRHYEYRK